MPDGSLHWGEREPRTARSTLTPYFRLNGMPSDPTDVASGTSPVTAGDIAFATEMMLKLPRHKLAYLTTGSTQDPHACGVCAVLRDTPGRYSDEQQEAVNALLRWHGADGMRCGVIYGIAAGLTAPRDEPPRPRPHYYDGDGAE